MNMAPRRTSGRVTEAVLVDLESREEEPPAHLRTVEETRGIPTDTPLPQRRYAPDVAPANMPQVTENAVPARAKTPPRRSKRPSILGMLFVFGTSGLSTLAVIVVPWFVLVSPTLHSLHETRMEAQQRPPAQIIEVPVPVPAPAPIAAPEIASAPEPEPVVAPAPRVRPAPVYRRPPPVPEPAPVVAAVAPTPAPAPQPVAAPEPPPQPPVPSEARSLTGRMAGSAGNKPLIMDLTFLGGGRVTATVDRGTESADVVGTYTMTGGVANVAFAVPGEDGGSYAVRVDGEGAVGRLALASGKSVKFKVRR